MTYARTLMILFAANAAQAQISKGSVLLGGSLSASTQNAASQGGETKSNGILVTPSFGFVIKNNTVVGFNLGYSGNKNEHVNYNETRNRFYSAGVFYRRYLNLGKQFYLFGEAGLGYDRTKSDQTIVPNDRIETKRSGVTLYVYPGITYAVSKRFHLEASINQLASLGYRRTITNRYFPGVIIPERGNSFSLATNVSASNPLSLGFRFLL